MSLPADPLRDLADAAQAALRVPASSTREPQWERAAFGLRIAAAAIDVVACSAPALLFLVAADRWVDVGPYSEAWCLLLVLSATATAYWLADVSAAATIGKRVLGLRVIGLDERASRGVRWLFKSLPPTAVALASAIMLAATSGPITSSSRRPPGWATRAADHLLWILPAVVFILAGTPGGCGSQTWYDRLARTAVVRRRSTVPATRGFEPIMRAPPAETSDAFRAAVPASVASPPRRG